MPVTYNLIASNTLSSSAASVTFSAIPNTFTDLVLRMSVRSTSTAANFVSMLGNYNTDTGSTNTYSITVLKGDGSTASSYRESNYFFISNTSVNAANSTSNTFTSYELYIPNYLVSANKPYSIISAGETNATGADISAVAGLWRNTAAITQIVLDPAGDFAAGSSFFLYGIKNS